MAMTRVTVTIPTDLVDEIDRLEKNRSRFVLEGVKRELRYRQREALRQSLGRPHPESSDLADEDIVAWADNLPQEDLTDLVDVEGGTTVRWVPGQGWVAEDA